MSTVKEKKATMVDFTTEEALLYLPQDTINNLNITTINIHLSLCSFLTQFSFISSLWPPSHHCYVMIMCCFLLHHYNHPIIADPLTNKCFGSSTFRRVFMDEMFSSLDIIMVSYERILYQNHFTNGECHGVSCS